MDARSDIADYPATNALPCPTVRTAALAEYPTRLARVADVMQERLINWGYAMCNAAMRAHVETHLTPPAGFPYPAAGVGA